MSRPAPRKCGRLDCAAAATDVIHTQYDGDVYRCAEHVDGAVNVFNKFDNRQTEGARVEPLPERK